MIFIVPVWSTQPWITRLLSLFIDHPKIFRVSKNVLSNPLHGNVHPLCPNLHLMACKVFGNISLTAAFLTTLPMSSCLLGDKARKNNIMFTLVCLQGKIDSMQPHVNDVLNFLHNLYDKGLSYSTLILHVPLFLTTYSLQHSREQTIPSQIIQLLLVT